MSVERPCPLCVFIEDGEKPGINTEGRPALCIDCRMMSVSQVGLLVLRELRIIRGTLGNLSTFLRGPKP